MNLSLLGILALFAFLVGASDVSKGACEIREARLKVGGGSIERLAYHSSKQEGLVRALEGNDVCKIAIALDGSCTLLQANLVLRSQETTQHAYIALRCEGETAGGESNEQITCRATIDPAQDALLAKNYKVTFIMAAKQQSGPSSSPKDMTIMTKEWDLLTLNLHQATISVSKDGRTADQKEDVFSKTKPEMLPPFEADPVPEAYLTPLLFTLLVLAPWIVLLGMWLSLGISPMPLSQIFLNWSWEQKFFLLCFILWGLLAVANWIKLSIFISLKIAAILTLITLPIGLRALRQTLPATCHQQQQSLKTD